MRILFTELIIQIIQYGWAVCNDGPAVCMLTKCKSKRASLPVLKALFKIPVTVVSGNPKKNRQNRPWCFTPAGR